MIMLYNIIEGVSIGLIIPIAVWAIHQVNKHRHKHVILEQSQRAQLRHNIITACRHAIKDGYVTPIDLESIGDQFDIYEQMCGNGTAKDYVSKARSLPVKGEWT